MALAAAQAPCRFRDYRRARMSNVFSAYHPVVGFSYLAIAIVFCMAAFHPVYVGISLAGALFGSFVFKGVGPTLRSLA